MKIISGLTCLNCGGLADLHRDARGAYTLCKKGHHVPITNTIIQGLRNSLKEASRG